MELSSGFPPCGSMLGQMHTARIVWLALYQSKAGRGRASIGFRQTVQRDARSVMETGFRRKPRDKTKRRSMIRFIQNGIMLWAGRIFRLEMTRAGMHADEPVKSG